jgi:SAM-dependent methyltransferase
MKKHAYKEYEQEAEDFDQIATERLENNQTPDIAGEWKNDFYYNNIWRDSVFFNDEYGPIIDWLSDKLKSANTLSVTEFGCGTGWLSLDLARKGFNVIGYDLSEKSIKIANEYISKLPELDSLNIKYNVKNIIDYDDYDGGSIICFGFLHHLPKDVLIDRVEYIYKNMNIGEQLLVVEPRYDFVNFEMAFMIQALRLALPNNYPKIKHYEDIYKYTNEIYRELGELDHNQSAHDNESPSTFIEDAINNCFDDIDINYNTTFFDKFIGSVRLSDKDNHRLSHLLKELDNIILKYNTNFARNIMISARKT